MSKNRNREPFSFANINLLGKCNVDCFFCLGKDIEELLSKHNQLDKPFVNWKNFDRFVDACHTYGIRNVYITGQNTDALLYHYLRELIDYLQGFYFSVGIRTNGYLALQEMNAINRCQRSVGYSIHSLDSETNFKIMKRRDIPCWERIIKATKNPRVSTVVNRFNLHEIWDLLEFLSTFENLKYIQVRKVSTDTRKEELAEDMRAFDRFHNIVKQSYDPKKTFCTAPIYEIYGKDVIFWNTVGTTVNSINYFTDGTLSQKYFIVEGYLNGSS